MHMFNTLTIPTSLRNKYTACIIFIGIKNVYLLQIIIITWQWQGEWWFCIGSSAGQCGQESSWSAEPGTLSHPLTGSANSRAPPAGLQEENTGTDQWGSHTDGRAARCQTQTSHWFKWVHPVQPCCKTLSSMFSNMPWHRRLPVYTIVCDFLKATWYGTS